MLLKEFVIACSQYEFLSLMSGDVDVLSNIDSELMSFCVSFLAVTRSCGID